MALLERLLQPQAAWSPPDPWGDDWGDWHSGQSSSWLTSAGVRVSPTSALMVSTVWSCVRVISETMASVPLVTYERQAVETKRRALEHPLYVTLHDMPNEHQTSFTWREMLTGHACLRGNGMSEIVTNGRDVELVPMHPGAVRMDVTRDGNLRYFVKDDEGRERAQPLLEDEVFHLRGPSDDGRVGMSVVSIARNSIGLAQAAENHGNATFRNGPKLAGVLQHPGRISPEAARGIRESWEATYGGVGNAGKTAVLWEDMKWQAVGMSNEDAQFLATREHQVADIARWFRVPLHMINETTKSTSWGTGIEQMTIGFVVYTMLPWARRWEQQLSKSLISEPRRFYAEFLFDGLLRGDIKTRYEAYAIAVQWGWMTRNEVRRLENMNPAEGLDEHLTPLNMATGVPPRPIAPRDGISALAVGEPVSVTPETAEGNELLQMLSREAAGRIVRKEIAAVKKAAAKYAADGDGWRRWLEAFYASHADDVARVLHIPEKAARFYAVEQRLQLEREGARVVESWDWRADHLAGLMMTGGGS
jgi:HK97 family phage portal protein